MKEFHFFRKHIKTGKNCNKLSKSVSHETLVGGTTTTGREYEQNQWLSKGSADKPLTAVGTLTSLLCNSAKVVEKWLQTLPVFRLVKIIILISVLFVGMVAESLAKDSIPTSGTCNSAGTCLWSIDSAGTLTISAKNGEKDVKMADYNCVGNPCNPSSLVARPWEANLKQIKSLVIGDNITKIGQDAFQNASNLKSVTGMNDVEHIRRSAFSYSGLESIIIPESIKKFEDQVFASNANFTEIIIPDSLNDESITLSDALFSRSCFTSSYASTKSSCAGAQIVCQGDVEKCKTVLEKFGGKGNCTLDAPSNCINPKKIVAANYQQCTDNYFWNGAKCMREPDVSKRKCCSSCKDMGGWCNRIRYTPAEAAEVLKDDNTNEVTITFKK